jgi:hypothetical protein
LKATEEISRIRKWIRSVDPRRSVFKWVSESGSRQAKIAHKNRKKLKNFIIGVFSVGLEASPGVCMSFVEV